MEGAPQNTSVGEEGVAEGCWPFLPSRAACVATVIEHIKAYPALLDIRLGKLGAVVGRQYIRRRTRQALG